MALSNNKSGKLQSRYKCNLAYSMLDDRRTRQNFLLLLTLHGVHCNWITQLY